MWQDGDDTSRTRYSEELMRRQLAREKATAQPRRAMPQSVGNAIMEMADLMRPYLLKQLKNSKDENGMPVSPSRVRGIALVVAQALVKAKPTTGTGA